MVLAIRCWVVLSLLLTASHFCSAQSARLSTADTVLELTAGPSAPRVVTLTTPGQPSWNNQAPEVLIANVRSGGRLIPLHWKFNAAASYADTRRVSYVYDSSSPRLQLTWEWTVRAQRGPIEHQIRIKNLGAATVWLPLQDSFRFDWKIPASGNFQHLFVEKGADTPSDVGTHLVNVSDGHHWEGTSSTYAHPPKNSPREIIPWLLVQSADAIQTGWYVGIEFSGRTRLSLVRKEGSLSGAVGLNPAPPPYWTRLQPQQVFETPTIFLGAFSGGPDAAGNILRHWVKEVLGNPETWKNPNYPFMVNNSWGSGMAVDETLALRMIEDSAELGLEMFHLDAGWFHGVGNWHPDPVKFPHGLAAIADTAHRRGLKFGLWVDWAQAGLSTSPGALNARSPKVRDWLANDLPADWKPEEFKGQTIDIGYPPAKAYAQAELERLVRDNHLDMLEHDGYLVAQGCVREDHPHAPPDPSNMSIRKDSGFLFVESSNSTDVSYHAVRAYYDIHSKLRKEHPGLLFEVCNDGGRMVDFGSAAHADYFSITDTYDPLSNRRAFYDTSHVLPPPMLESYVEKWPTPRIENLRYMLRSGMMGWTSIMLDTTAWTDEQHAVAKAEFETYKSRLRPLIREANLYHVSTRPDGIHWDGMQYFDPGRGKGVLYAFRGSAEDEPNHTFILKGLQPEGSYRLTFNDHSSQSITSTGAQLMKEGLLVNLPVPNSSELVFIEQLR